MRRFLLLASVAALCCATTGCYTSRRIAGDDLKGGIMNPYLWVTVPIDAVMSPFQIPNWMSDPNDEWKPWSPDWARERVHPVRFEPLDIR